MKQKPYGQYLEQISIGKKVKKDTPFLKDCGSDFCGNIWLARKTDVVLD